MYRGTLAFRAGVLLCCFVGTQQCVDKISDCATYGPNECNKYPAWAQDNCQHTCNLCPTGGGAGSSTQQCVDKISDCATYGANACNEYQAWAQDNCQHTCNLCPTGGGPSNTTQQCVDKISDCATYGANACNEYQAWAQDNCQHTCNLCPTGPPSGCYYKGQVHAQGSKWDDGCDFNCTCMDGATGEYTCNDICPTYKDLPTNCHFEKPANECCSKPVCENVLGCYYKGQLHAQGTQWDDGCDYNCTCMDGATGLYECDAMCLTFNLPAICHYNPPPHGLCCKVPSCPPNVVVDYPPGYVPK